MNLADSCVYVDVMPGPYGTSPGGTLSASRVRAGVMQITTIGKPAAEW